MEKLPLNPQTHIPTAKCTMHQVQRGTGGVRHSNKNQHGKICNVSFGEQNWSQASLPIRYAGLGLRSTADLSLPCFLSSSHACKGLVNRLIPPPHHDSSPLEKKIQAAWDDLACRDTLNSLLNTTNP